MEKEDDAQSRDSGKDTISRESISGKEEIFQLVKGCMKSLNLPPDDYSKSFL